MEQLTNFDWVKAGFFIGLGWWAAKIIYVLIMMAITKKKFELSAGDN